MSEALTLEEIENRIRDIYHWMAQEAPGVVPRESGALGTYWALFDREVEAQGEDLH